MKKSVLDSSEVVACTRSGLDAGEVAILNSVENLLVVLSSHPKFTGNYIITGEGVLLKNHLFDCY